MFSADMLVGVVSIVVGAVVVLAAVFNWQWYYDLHKARWVESICGRGGARVFFAVLGLGLILLGGAIAAGWFASPGSSRKQDGGSGSQRVPRAGTAAKTVVI